MRLILLLFFCLVAVNSFKYLVHATRFAKSHVNFLARLADTLVDAGHEVVVLSPIMNSRIGDAMTKKARVIEIPQCAEAAAYEEKFDTEFSQNVWIMRHPVEMFMERRQMFGAWAHLCNSELAHPGLIEQLKEEKFDAAFTESFDFCAPVLFRLLSIDKWAITESVAIRDGGFHYTQTPGNPAYVPSMMSGRGEAMPFLGRLSNTISFVLMDFFINQFIPQMEEIIKQQIPDLPPLNSLLAANSLVFLNSEPLVDFPKITSARIIDIGGITVASGHAPLNQTWSDILDLRPRTILLSFGTIAKSFAMPDDYKATIRETFRKFPDVTFIWKYEMPEHKISQGIENIVESTWIPQRDMLHDSRLTAFITHCGQGSTTEAIDAGIPLIVIPVLGDQGRNAYQVERNGIGIRLDKTDLASVGKLEEAIRNILSNPRYRKNAERVRSMVADRPFPMKEIFVKNMEFLAKHGPLRQLDHYGRHLNFIQYYLIDVIAFVVVIVLGVGLNLLLLFLIIKCSKPHLGNYKNLLKIFACNDIFMAIAHAVVQPYIISVACGWFTVPFTLMNINFLHRFWSVRSPHKIDSFSKLSFAVKIVPYPIIMAIQWGLAAYSVCDNAFGKEIMRKSIPDDSEITVGDGWLILHYWENDKLNLSALAVLVNDSTIMTVNFSIAGIFCYLTVRHIRAEITFSPSYKNFQFKVLRALFAQSAIPVLCVYFPFGIGVSQPLLLPIQSKATFGPWFTFISSFPAMDALVIIWLMRDYRDGLLSMIFGKHWKAENSISIQRTTQVNPI